MGNDPSNSVFDLIFGVLILASSGPSLGSSLISNVGRNIIIIKNLPESFEAVFYNFDNFMRRRVDNIGHKISSLSHLR